jgi:hypothetical protein
LYYYAAAGLLAPLKVHMGKLDFSIAVGQTHTHSDSTGVNAYIELHNKLTSKQIEPLPKGTGLAVVIDMSTRDNISSKYTLLYLLIALSITANVC